ncbi:MAG: 7-cyano-7-deazaguanine synthase QueC [Maricaulaceae bacterium]
MLAQKRKALVLFSGGQDSGTCLPWALSHFDYVETIGFHYEQRHDVEMTTRLNLRREIIQAFPDWEEKLGPDHIIDLGALGRMSETALTRDEEIKMNADGLPSTFVPGRNLIFLNFAAALGYRRGISTLVGGMCEADFSGYPDCRKETLDATLNSISLGMGRDFTLETPLMFVDKAGAWKVAYELGGEALIEIILEQSHTCYLGERGPRHAWGYGCGTCPACELRAKGWADYSNSQQEAKARV